MKENEINAEYIAAEIEIVSFSNDDIILTSNSDYDGWTDL